MNDMIMAYELNVAQLAKQLLFERLKGAMNADSHNIPSAQVIPEWHKECMSIAEAIVAL